MHSAVIHWGGQPGYALGRLAVAAIAYSARWWRGDLAAAPEDARAQAMPDRPVEVLAAPTVVSVTHDA